MYTTDAHHINRIHPLWAASFDLFLHGPTPKIPAAVLNQICGPQEE